MQAMHGFAGSFRKGRVIGCCMALALAVSAMTLAPSAGAVTHPTKDYLALGDSLAFGYTQVKHTENQPGNSPAFFEEGYSHWYAKKVRASKLEDNKGLIEVNDGCPGESSDSFKGEGVNIGLGVNCNYQAYFTLVGPGTPGGPLHNPYPGKSQKSNMLQILKGGSPAHPIEVISINIGANDELAEVSACKAQVKEEYEATFNPGPPASATSVQPKGAGPGKEAEYHLAPNEIAGAISSCIAFRGVTKTFPHIVKNLETTLEEIYGVGGYTGKTVVVGNYNPFTFLLSGSDALQKLLNERIEEAIPGTGKNYEGKVKFANPFLKFNGASEASKAEQTKICKFTEMCNPTAQAENKAAAEAKQKSEESKGKFIFFPFNPAEGDIHPTKMGAEQLGKTMYEALPL